MMAGESTDEALANNPPATRGTDVVVVAFADEPNDGDKNVAAAVGGQGTLADEGIPTSATGRGKPAVVSLGLAGVVLLNVGLAGVGLAKVGLARVGLVKVGLATFDGNCDDNSPTAAVVALGKTPSAGRSGAALPVVSVAERTLAVGANSAPAGGDGAA